MSKPPFPKGKLYSNGNHIPNYCVNEFFTLTMFFYGHFHFPWWEWTKLLGVRSMILKKEGRGKAMLGVGLEKSVCINHT